MFFSDRTSDLVPARPELERPSSALGPMLCCVRYHISEGRREGPRSSTRAKRRATETRARQPLLSGVGLRSMAKPRAPIPRGISRVSGVLQALPLHAFSVSASYLAQAGVETLRKVVDEREDDQERPRAVAGRSGPRPRVATAAGRGR